MEEETEYENPDKILKPSGQPSGRDFHLST